MTTNTLGKYLRDKRVEAGLTQLQIASKLGYGSPQFISNIERDCCVPPQRVLRGMVRAYKIPTEELLLLLLEIDFENWCKKLGTSPLVAPVLRRSGRC